MDAVVLELLPWSFDRMRTFSCFKKKKKDAYSTVHMQDCFCF